MSSDAPSARSDRPSSTSRTSETPGPPRRISPITNEMTTAIIAPPPADAAPQIAPDVPVPIDPGPVPGVARDSSDHTAVVEVAPQDGDGPVTALTPALVARLQEVHGSGCVSVLMTTRKAARMSDDDALRLRRLQADASARLAQQRPAAEQAVLESLDRLVDQVTTGPTDQAVALYAGPSSGSVSACAVRLPVAVDDRVAVDPTFATRDLVRALHRTPRHVVLVLSASGAVLLDGAGGTLTPATASRFPLRLSTTGTAGGGTGGGERGHGTLRDVDQALGAYLRLRPAPVVLAGPQTLVAEFLELSQNVTRLAGTVYGGFDHGGFDHGDPDDGGFDHGGFDHGDPDDGGSGHRGATAGLDRRIMMDLAARIRPVVNRYLASREHAATQLLAERVQQGRHASGIQSTWRAARQHLPEMLVVEESYRYPARLSADGDRVTPAGDLDAPDVIDDLVDELIETVLDRGGWIALARDGALGDHDRVALTLRAIG